MIPSIETIVDDLAAGTITKAQAVNWLHQHAEDAGRDLRDDFAGQALIGLLSNENAISNIQIAARAEDVTYPAYAASIAYFVADAMLKERVA